MLVGRELEVDRLLALITGPERANPSELVDGPMGIGKTSLLAEVGRRAAAGGTTVLKARTDRLERDFGFGVVRQLLERPVSLDSTLLEGAASTTRAVFTVEAAEHTGPADTPVTVLHGLYWVVVRLAEQAPLLLLIDDIQWIDQPSLRWLNHLLRRLDGLPITVIAARRADVLDTGEQLELPRFGRRSTLAGLARPAVDQLIRERLDPSVAAEFVTSCRDATGGNPLLLTALLRSCREQGVRTAARITRFGPEEINQLVQDLITPLGADGITVMRAVAVLGDGVSPELVSAVTEVAPAEVHGIVHKMARAGLMVAENARSVSFVHAVVREAIAAGMLPSAANLLRAKAASALHDSGADSERVSAQLLRLLPLGADWAAEVLLDAAGTAARRGAPESAATYLRRAMREPLSSSRRADALIDLGAAEVGFDLDAAIGHLADGVQAATTEAQRARAALLRARALCVRDRYPEAIHGLLETEELLQPETPTRTVLAVERSFISVFEPRFAEETWRRWSAPAFTGYEGTRVEGEAAAFRAFQCTTRGGTAQQAVPDGRRALELRLAGAGSGGVFGGAVLALQAADDLEFGLQLSDRSIEAATKSGALFTYAVWCTHRGEFHNRMGNLAEAQADLQASVSTRVQHLGVDPLSSHVAVAAGRLLDVLVTRGRLQAVRELLYRWKFDGPIPDHLLFIWVLGGRARLRLAEGDPVRALADFQRALDLARRCGVANPIAFITVHELVSAALLAGRPGQARELAEQHADACRQWGTPHALGLAARTLALVSAPERRCELLRESAHRLERSPSRLDHACTLADLGFALIDAGHAVEARRRLSQAADLAEQCGATVLSDRALTGVKAAGGRPRSRRTSGVDALTPSERRVAVLAAKGASNQDIAQQLFVGLRTVEVHLTNTYRKLGIRGRNDLAGAFGPRRGAHS